MKVKTKIHATLVLELDPEDVVMLERTIRHAYENGQVVNETWIDLLLVDLNAFRRESGAI